MNTRSRKDARAVRHARLRRKVIGTADRPRLAIALSNKYVYVQFIDDEKGVTLASVSSLDMEGRNNVATAGLVGQKALQQAQAVNIKRVVVDRGGHKFHGRVKAIVDPLKAAGLLTESKEEK
jgi:large subunit ribosomal protein L18